MKLGPRTGNTIVIVATLLFALPMFLVGVANGAQGWTATTTVTVEGGRIDVPEQEPAVAVQPDNDTAGAPAPVGPPPVQGNVPEPPPATEPADPGPTTATTPPTIEVPGLPVDPPADEDPEPAPDEPTGP